MKVYEAYELAIRTGMSRDPRPESEVRRVLEEAAREYEGTPEADRELFDMESLWNPYSDCRFSACEEEAREAEAESLMWGIDVGTGEVLLADRLRERGARVDALVAHHPLGKSRVLFPKVMGLQADLYHSEGVPINVAEGIMGPRTDEALRGVMGVNHNQAADAAGLLGIPLFNVHSAADNMVQAYLTDLFEEKEPERLGDIVDALMGEPEYREAAKSNARPRIMVGSRDSRCGRVMCKMTGGTSGPKSMYEALARAGVGTVVCMHCPESHYEAAREAHVNIVISGHMPSDSLGVNLIADVWEREGIDVIPCSGLIRVSRNRHVRPQVHSHTRRLQARLRLRAQDPRPPRGADGQDGDALPPAGHGRPRVHRVPDRGRWDRQDRHREEVLRGHGGLHGRPRQADRHDLRELQELLRGGGAPADDTPLRRGVP